MRRQIIVILLSLFCFALPSAWGADRGALFKVSGNGHTMYLFGTIHVGVPAFYPLEPRIAAAVAGASTLALEIDAGRDPVAMARALKQHGMLAPGGSLYQRMKPELRERLQKELARVGIDPAVVTNMKPWLAATLLTLGEFGSQGYRPQLAVDLHLAKLARERGVPVTELETIDAQLALFSAVPEAEQLGFLEEAVTLAEQGKQAAEARQAVDAWGSADQAGLDAIARRIEEDQTASGRFMREVVLEQRNVTLADKLTQLLAQKNNSVAAVGVLHLVGKTSVPALLRARGMAVERVY
ncbi:TraB/GumN family protein [Massilia sp. RP-1-19]|uniref:TraB/GumN family protein n=1 Tax=Massilia polaris TaxID=2728846 RepID=A0A848HG46_9BURK|nr:TraB/GumN family protein [Massilia polaris]NML60435.1 TraB/GumN family protein [Massilia polaris]